MLPSRASVSGTPASTAYSESSAPTYSSGVSADPSSSLKTPTHAR